VGCRIRHWIPNTVYSAVIRCVDRQFLLKPNHDPQQHPLLAKGCPETSLRAETKTLPRPSVLNTIGAAVARAQKLHPVHVHAVEANVNHLQLLVSADKSQIANLSPFFQTLDSTIARSLNRTHHRDGRLWSSRVRVTPCIDDRAAEQQLLYILTNPVKDGLLESVAESPLFTTYTSLAHGKPLRYWRIDWSAYQLAGGSRKKGHSPKDYLEWLRLELDPLPHQAGWAEHRRRAWVRRQVREFEEAKAAEMRAEGRRALGASALFALDPRGRPREAKENGPQPLCHASDPVARREYVKQWRELVRAYRAASIEYRLGMWEREFPEGTFRPPLVRCCGVLRL